MSEQATTADQVITPPSTDVKAPLPTVSVDPTQSSVEDVFDNAFMSCLAGVFLMVCVFAILGIYCQTQKKKKFTEYEWNNNGMFTVPFHLCQMSGWRESEQEKTPILSPSGQTTINMYTAKNKAYSKYPRIKRKFPYFVTIPEEDENDQDCRRLQTKLFPKHYPNY